MMGTEQSQQPQSSDQPREDLETVTGADAHPHEPELPADSHDDEPAE